MTYTDTHDSPEAARESDAATAAKSLRDDLNDKARETAQHVREDVTRAAHDRKSGLADEAASIAGALRKAASDLRAGSPQERTFAQVADTLADTSETLRDKDFGEMAQDLSKFARRNPLVFLGGAALIGATAARFAKASSRKTHEAVHSDTYHSNRSATAAMPVGEPRTAPKDYYNAADPLAEENDQ